MSTQPVKASSQERISSAPVFYAVLGWSCIALLTFVSVRGLKPPASIPATAPANQFSAERAMSHVRAIARMPHPMGDASNIGAREYLLAQLSALGFAPQEFSALGILKTPRGVSAGFPHDVIGRLAGSANSKAVMLMAHYDSVDRAPGAADDASGVAAILESLRVLRADAQLPLKNDLIVLFTDGEEPGLLGAEAFASSHPWMKDIGVILNFEARGDRGPSMLFETSGGNRLLIKAFAKAAPYPIGSSLFYNLYKLLPNDTDLTVFRPSHTAGLNFAFGERLEAYHSPLDTPENLSAASLQHQGTYTLSLAREFGQADLNHLAQTPGDEIFFNWFGSNLVHYDQRWILPGEIIATLLLVLLVTVTKRRADVQWKHILLAALACACIVIVIPLLMGAAAWLVLHIVAGHVTISDCTGNTCLLAGFVLLGTCAFILIFSWLRKRFSAWELALAGLLLLNILSWPVAFFFPAGSHLLFWPLLLALAVLLLLEILKSKMAWLAGLVGVAASILLSAPLAWLLYIFLTLQWGTVAAVGLLLGLAFLASILFLDIAVPQRASRPVMLVLLIGAVSLMVTGAVKSEHGGEHPYSDTVSYSLNADDKAAVWFSYDSSTDDWSSQLIARNSKPRPIPRYLAGSEYPVLSGPASKLDIPPPVMELKANTSDGGLHKIRMTVRSQRNANRIYLVLDNAEPVSIKIADRMIVSGLPREKMRLILFGIPASGVDVEMELKASSKVSFWLMDQTYSLPENHPRPEGFIAREGSDATIVCRKYDL